MLTFSGTQSFQAVLNETEFYIDSSCEEDELILPEDNGAMIHPFSFIHSPFFVFLTFHVNYILSY